MAEHLLLTNFEVRIPGFGIPNPLEPQRLNWRIQLFELLTAPSVRAQTSDRFTWLIQIDPELPAAIRERIEQAVQGVRSYRILEHRPGGDLADIAHCRPYLSGPGNHAALTLLDDDDGLHEGILLQVQDKLFSRSGGSGLPPLSFMGCRSAVEWDFLIEDQAPLGRVKPWSYSGLLNKSFPANTGFTILFQKSLAQLPLRACQHNLIHVVRQIKLPAMRPKSQLHRNLLAFQHLLRAVSKAFPAWDRDASAPGHAFYQDFTGPGPQGVIINHSQNLQSSRLTRPSEAAAPVLGPETFPGVAINWDLARRALRDARRPSLPSGQHHTQ